MRTTLDLPDELLRQAKSRAALRGMKLREFVEEALHAALYYRDETAAANRVADEGDPDVLVLSEDCVFPLIRGVCGPAMRDATSESLNQILEEEEVERSLGSSRR